MADLAQLGIELTGDKQALTKLQRLKKEAKELRDSVKDVRIGGTRRATDALQKQSKQIQQLNRDLQKYRDWQDRLISKQDEWKQKTIDSYVDADKAAKQYRQGIRKDIDAISKKQFKGLTSGQLSEYEGQIRQLNKALLGLENTISNADYKRLSKQLDGAGRRLRNVKKDADFAYSSLIKFWERFGKVGLGFSIIYGAIQAVSAAMQELVRVFREGIQLSGELAATQTKLATYFALGNDAVSFGQALEMAKGNVRALAEASLNSVSKLDELTTAYDELAQHGIFVTEKLMQEMAAFSDFTVLVAQTTGNTARQIRSEFAGMLEGRMRATNVMLRYLVRMGFVTDEMLQQLRNAEDVSEKFLDILRKVGPELKDMQRELQLRDVTLMWNKWLNSLQMTVSRGVNYASELEGVANIFAQLIFKHKEHVVAMMENEETMKDMTATVLTIRDALDIAMTGFEKIIFGLSSLTATVRENWNWIQKLLQAFLAYTALKTVLPLLRGFRAVLLLMVSPVKKLYDWMKKLAAISTASALRSGISALITAFTSWTGIALSLGAALYFVYEAMNKISGAAPEVDKNIDKTVKEYSEATRGTQPVDIDILGGTDKKTKPKSQAEKAMQGGMGFFEAGFSGIKERFSKVTDFVKKQLKNVFDVDIKLPSLDPDGQLKKELSAEEKALKAVEAALKATKNTTVEFFDTVEKYVDEGKPGKIGRYVPFARKEVQMEIENTRKQLEQTSRALELAKGKTAENTKSYDQLILKNQQLQLDLEKLQEKLDYLDFASLNAKVNKWSDNFQQQLDKINAKFDKGSDKWVQAAQKLIEKYEKILNNLPENVSGSTQKLIDSLRNDLNKLKKDVKDNSSDIMDELGKAMEGWASNFSRQLNDMLWSAELTFEKIAESFGKMITQIVIQKQIVEPLFNTVSNINWGSLVSGGNTGVDIFNGGSTAPAGIGTRNYASGGWINEPVSGIGAYSGDRYNIAEAGPEYVSRGPGGVNIEIVDQRGADAPAVEKQESQGPDGMKQIKLFIRSEVKGMANDGSLDKEMDKNYGVKRRAY